MGAGTVKAKIFLIYQFIGRHMRYSLLLERILFGAIFVMAAQHGVPAVGFLVLLSGIIALLGGALFMAYFGSGPPSVDNRMEHYPGASGKGKPAAHVLSGSLHH